MSGCSMLVGLSINRVREASSLKLLTSSYNTGFRLSDRLQVPTRFIMWILMKLTDIITSINFVLSGKQEHFTLLELQNSLCCQIHFLWNLLTKPLLVYLFPACFEQVRLGSQMCELFITDLLIHLQTTKATTAPVMKRASGTPIPMPIQIVFKSATRTYHNFISFAN